jgi:hypothetical protein
MGAAALPNPVERINTAEACRITGLSSRRMQQKAERREIPGAAKFDGIWTFNEARLRAWVADREKDQCATTLDAAPEPESRPSPTPTGAVLPATKSFGRASSSRGSRSAGRSDLDTLFEQAMSKLRAAGSKRAARS